MITHKDLGHVQLIEIEGQFGVEDAYSIRKACLKKYRGQKIVFNLNQASFVGSSGLIPLLRDLQIMGEQTQQPVRLVGLRSEVKRLMNGLGIKGFDTFESVHEAIVAI